MNTNEMILYNVTISIDKSIRTQWLQWMQEVHIPRIMACGIFVDYKLLSMLSEKNPDTATFALQLFAPSMATLHQYQIHHAQGFQQMHDEQFSGQTATFRTLLEVVEQA